MRRHAARPRRFRSSPDPEALPSRAVGKIPHQRKEQECRLQNESFSSFELRKRLHSLLFTLKIELKTYMLEILICRLHSSKTTL